MVVEKTYLFLHFPVNLKVSSFDLILCLEYLMKILQFVSVPQDEVVSKPIAAVPSTATTASKSMNYFTNFFFSN